MHIDIGSKRPADWPREMEPQAKWQAASRAGWSSADPFAGLARTPMAPGESLKSLFDTPSPQEAPAGPDAPVRAKTGAVRPFNHHAIDRFNSNTISKRQMLRLTAICISQADGDVDRALACLDGLALCGRWNDRSGSWETVEPNTVVCTAAMRVCAKADRPDLALKLFRHLLEKGPEFDPPAYPDTVTYNTLIAGCSDAGMTDMALDLLDHLLRRGASCPIPVFADTITFSTALIACQKAGRTETTLQLFSYLLRDGPTLPRPVFPGCSVYNSVMMGCTTAHRLAETFQAFEHLLSQGPGFPQPVYPNSIILGAAILAYEKSGDTGRYAEMLRAGMRGFGQTRHPILRRSLGFDRALNQLDLHAKAVELPSQRHETDRTRRGVSSALARAIFHCLLLEPELIWGPGATGIDIHTRFVVGHSNALHSTIVECMRAQGWVATPVLDLQGAPDMGCLVATPLPGQPARTPPA